MQTPLMQTGLMQRAIELSIENVRTGSGGPFAALVTRGSDIVSTGVNCVTSSNDPTAHAEVVAIREACKRLATFQLSGCDLYTTCEPCPMCLGAIYWARLDRVFYGNTRADAARIGFDDALIYGEVCGSTERRKIPMRPLMREQALEAFREWERSASKIAY
jgi:guanine deaminase